MKEKVVDTVPISTRVTKTTRDQIVKKLGIKYLNIADYLRDLVRRDLEHEN